ncbi:ORF MSV174 hypothetical protein [Melanoplus sanguinipes entomopoxvirus]|uniref:Uncharacterized protein n=1 Tax=Melanoplus sanguinipes entomopoxvirus TaxID=83191 RepID=Q9YVR7_MSEPV|nr:ORF MSV174 hypothetical protein [Melanoplus sanguinipes entomopoxvirus]AAC97688.1 ORF MSV174 hypothetical protein [Melanoplus sanguinipes entomopoxvirus 'O']
MKFVVDRFETPNNIMIVFFVCILWTCKKCKNQKYKYVFHISKWYIYRYNQLIIDVLIQNAV